MSEPLKTYPKNKYCYDCAHATRYDKNGVLDEERWEDYHVHCKAKERYFPRINDHACLLFSQASPEKCAQIRKLLDERPLGTIIAYFGK